MRLRVVLTWALTLGLAGLLLWLSVRGVDWRRVVGSLAHANRGMLAMAFSGASAAVVLRSERWRILLGAGGPISAGLVFWSTAVGYLGNNVLPARMGELLRMRAIASKTRLSNSYVLATALTERALDAGVLVLVSCCALLAAPDLPQWLRGAAASMAAASGVTLVAIVLLPKCESWMHAALRRVPCGPGIRSRLAGLVSSFLLGIRSFHHTGRAVRFLGMTAVVWMIDAVTAVVVANAISVRLDMAEALLVVAALALSSALPSTPGAVGVYQFVAVSVMAPLGVARDESLAFVFLYQGIVVATLALWGLIGMWRLKAWGAEGAGGGHRGSFPGRAGRAVEGEPGALRAEAES